VTLSRQVLLEIEAVLFQRLETCRTAYELISRDMESQIQPGDALACSAGGTSSLQHFDSHDAALHRAIENYRVALVEFAELIFKGKLPKSINSIASGAD